MGKPQKRLYPRTITFYLIRGKPSLLRVVAAISFSLVNLIKQVSKGNNEYSNLN